MAQASDYDSETSLDLVLIGKTGSGKSATGNSILRRENIFTVGYGFQSETKLPKYDWSEFEGRTLHVVDSPGVIDTVEDELGKITLVHTALQNAILANPKGYHAFLVVVKFASRFTKEEQKAVEILKEILGKKFLKDFGIIVMANGDTFEHFCQKNTDNLSLETFCADQNGPFKRILEECNNRIVVFNNQTQDEKVQNQQVKQLVDLVDKLDNGGKRYTNKQFQLADKIFQSTITTSKLSTVDKNILKELSLISHAISKRGTLEQKLTSLKTLEPRINKLILDLKDIEAESGAQDNLIKNVNDTEKIITDRIKIFENSIAQKQELKQREEEISREEKELNKKVKRKNGENLRLKEQIEESKKDLNEEKKSLNKKH